MPETWTFSVVYPESSLARCLKERVAISAEAYTPCPPATNVPYQTVLAYTHCTCTAWTANCLTSGSGNPGGLPPIEFGVIIYLVAIQKDDYRYANVQERP